MKRAILKSFLVLAFLMTASAFAQNTRMDCRFYNIGVSLPQFCYSSATYDVTNGVISDASVQFGVGCDQQTVYNNSGTVQPILTIADHIRPATAATPLVELVPSNSLAITGTYTAKLELSSGTLLNGQCYVVGAPTPSPSPSVVGTR